MPSVAKLHEIMTLLTQSSKVMCDQGRTEKSRKLIHKALALARKHFGADSTVVATIQADIWATYLVHVHQVPQFSAEVDSMYAQALADEKASPPGTLPFCAEPVWRRWREGTLFDLRVDDAVLLRFAAGDSGKSRTLLDLFVCSASAMQHWPNGTVPVPVRAQFVKAAALACVEASRRGYAARGWGGMTVPLSSAPSMRVARNAVCGMLLYGGQTHPGTVRLREMAPFFNLSEQERADIQALFLLSDSVIPSSPGAALSAYASSSADAESVAAASRAYNERTGLQTCSRPGCGAMEQNARQFKQCSICRDSFYCSDSCFSLDWKRHKKAACVKSKSRRNDNEAL